MAKQTKEKVDDFNFRLRAAAFLRGIKMKDLPLAAGMCRATFYKKREGKVDFTLPEAERLAKALQVQPSDLWPWMGGEQA